MEELLNKLIEKGWKPFREDKIDKIREGRLKYVFFSGISSLCRTYSIREITSKESGLWQFVCENEMIKLKFGDRRHYNTDNYRNKICLDCNYPYWLMESALCDEDKLEDFILDNIKI